MEEIINRVEKSDLVSFDLSLLRPEGKRIGLDLKDFLLEGWVLREQEFRNQLKTLDLTPYQDAFVYVYCSTDAIIPAWTYLLLGSALHASARKIIYGSSKDLEMALMQEAIASYDFTPLENKKVLVKGCSNLEAPENAYLEIASKLSPIVQSLMFGEACSNVPILKRKVQ